MTLDQDLKEMNNLLEMRRKTKRSRRWWKSISSRTRKNNQSDALLYDHIRQQLDSCERTDSGSPDLSVLDHEAKHKQQGEDTTVITKSTMLTDEGTAVTTPSSASRANPAHSSGSLRHLHDDSSNGDEEDEEDDELSTNGDASNADDDDDDDVNPSASHSQSELETSNTLRATAMAVGSETAASTDIDPALQQQQQQQPHAEDMTDREPPQKSTTTSSSRVNLGSVEIPVDRLSASDLAGLSWPQQQPEVTRQSPHPSVPRGIPVPDVATETLPPDTKPKANDSDRNATLIPTSTSTPTPTTTPTSLPQSAASVSRHNEDASPATPAAPADAAVADKQRQSDGDRKVLRASSSALSTISSSFSSTTSIAHAQSRPSSYRTKKRKFVRFTSVQVRWYPIMLGDNPACSCGPPLMLDWNPMKAKEFNINDFETQRNIKRSSRADGSSSAASVRTSTSTSRSSARTIKSKSRSRRTSQSSRLFVERQLKLSSSHRRELLMRCTVSKPDTRHDSATVESGVYVNVQRYTREDIDDVVKQMQKVQRQRSQTRQSSSIMEPIELVCESMMSILRGKQKLETSKRRNSNVV